RFSSNDTSTTAIYTLSLHDALPILFHQILHWHHFYDRATLEAGLVSDGFFHAFGWFATVIGLVMVADVRRRSELRGQALVAGILDRKSTRLNSSHVKISYAVFCLKK